MICYWHASETKAPSWLSDAVGLAYRQVRTGYAFGIGDGYKLSEPPKDAKPLAGGWLVWLKGDLVPQTLIRKDCQYQTLPVLDSKNRVWWIPLICNYRGERAFDVTYGKDWLPELSEDQQMLLRFAKESRDFYAAKAAETPSQENPEAMGTAADEEINLVCPQTAEWAARAYCAALHLDVEVIQVLGLMDGHLISGGIVTMASIDVDVEEDHSRA